MTSNFAFLAEYWPDMAQIGKMAELYLYTDSNACIFKLGMLAERVAQEICVMERVKLSVQATHADRIRALKYADFLPKRIDDIFYALRKARNQAVHAGADFTNQAEAMLRMAFSLCCWFMEVYGDWSFTPPEYEVPDNQSQNADYAQRLRAQEEKIQNLLAMVEEIRTSASEVSRQARTQKAEEVANELPYSSEEEMCVASDPVKVDVVALPSINFALQQSGIPMIRAIMLTNTTNEAIRDVTIHISTTPAFSVPFTRHIECIPANKTIELSKPRVVLAADYLASVTERLTGVLNVSVQDESTVLAEDHVEVAVLAFDEWHGRGIYPELLAMFVTPNHPEIARIIARATDFLGQWTGDTAMDAYQSQDPNRVISQAAAIFTAIKEQQIAYAVAPASFESAGQRIRLCDAVLQQKLGNCLDLTLLYASCLEAVGLHPILINTTGHIFTGVWLEDKMFPETVQDDASQITKRLASGINEIAVIETTCVTTSGNNSFDDARTVGERELSGDMVECIIDVRRARLNRILPLPQRVQSGLGWRVVRDVPLKDEDASAPRKLSETVKIDVDRSAPSIPKKVQWERKLLDLGMRNTLINLRLTKTQLPILTTSLDRLEDALADGSDFSIMPRPIEWKAPALSFENMNEMGAAALVDAEFQNRRLRAAYTEAELAGTVKNLYRASRTALEENGANTLYLALGLLRWYENSRSTKPRYAPIILLPVELVRKSVAQGYVIRMRDDEPQMNITLLEKLKQDFGITVKGLDPLPEDGHGIDIRKVLTIMRKAVMEQSRWDVVEVATMGIFSFSQFVMWNDIRNRTDDLMRNKIVRSLIEGRLVWDAQPMEVGARVKENGVLLPMPADASQLYAIQAACNGESFVLHGPPGTGKSQTITSLIANALANGKSVLFVAEKMAALEVVQKRLDNIGIGPFCLELHSNKSKKKDVLEQLRRASEVTKRKSAEQFAAKADQLAAMRAELDDYVRQLHAVQYCGKTLYELINQYESCADAPDIAPFDRTFACGLDAGALELRTLAVERLAVAAKEIGHPHEHPLDVVRRTQYTQQLRGNLRPAIENYRSEIAGISGSATKLAAVLGRKVGCFEDLQELVSIAKSMLCWYDFPRAWTKAEMPLVYFDEVIELAGYFRRANQLEEQLLTVFLPEFLQQDGEALFAEYVQVSSKWLIPKLIGTSQLTGRMNAFAKTPLPKDSLRTHITALCEYQTAIKAGEMLLVKYRSDFGDLYCGKNSDWEKIEQLAQRALAGARELFSRFGSHDFLHQFCGRPQDRDAVLVVADRFACFVEAKETLHTLLCIEERPAEEWFAAQDELCNKLLAHADELKEWVAFVGIAKEAEALGMTNVVESYTAGMAHEEILPAYRKAMLFALISGAIDAGNALNTFSGAVFNEKIQQYQRADAEWTRLSQEEVYCRLASKVPNFTREAAHSSELGILQRCIKSGGRGVSIRNLFDQIPNLLPRLCPCMLMSPISAAQYLDPKRAPFDIVVFDEASQLPTCKAVGVLARGENAVIVGDPKQMPPTSFFATNTVDEDNLDLEDLESILDDCLALNMPQTHLLWHYRSRHESLIAFSNNRFYDNKLFTFPSVNDRESKVRLVHVEGVFERGKNRRNLAEATAVVEELKRRCHDPELAKLSVGVVTFNITQQNLIDDLLTEACATDAELEKWAYGAEEPVFIKNLENVQGDERDVILFSVGYGPDENGKVYMNFGPLNRNGGWRRLNVAVSRARCEMIVFATLRADQIDLNRTSAEGVAALRAFLEYAERNTLVVDETTVQMQPEHTQGIARAICAELKKHGYDTEFAVGRSEYRIDIGVVDPQNKEQYILGIMLDGSTYGTAKTTRDREIAQIDVLRGLGWRILRVWCMDWWDNRAKEMKRILAALHEVESGKAEPPPKQSDDEKQTVLQNNGVAADKSARHKEAKRVTAPIYSPAILQAKFVSAETFVEPWFVREIQARIHLVINAEAPISMSLLTKRVIQSCGIARAGTRIQGQMHRALAWMNVKETQQGDTVFYWSVNQAPDAYALYRVNGEGDCRRDVRDVAVQEIANAVCVVLYEQLSMLPEDLLRETAKKMGYTRLGGNVLPAMEAGVKYAAEQGRVKLGANGLYILTESGTARAEMIVL